MQRPWSILLLAAGVFLLGCGADPKRASGWGDWRPVPTRFATKFKLWAHGDDRLVLVFGHGGDRDTVGRYLISQDTSLNGPVEAVHLITPLRRMAMLSTTHIPFVSRLGRAQAVVAGANLDRIRDTELRTMIDAGLVEEVGTGQGVDRERLLALDVQAVFTYPFGKSEGGSFQGLQIPVVEVTEYIEEHPLGRAEWLRFFGVMLGEERMADSLFQGIAQRYEQVRVSVRKDSTPTVLFGSCWNGQWFVPPGNSYMARLIDDAGGRYVFADRKGDGNITVDMETMITVGANADVWGMITAEEGPLLSATFTGGDERLEDFKAISSHNLFANNKEADLFGQALLEPDILLQDLCCIFRTGQCPKAHRARAAPAYFGPAKVSEQH